jgi:hypothetical protein
MISNWRNSRSAKRRAQGKRERKTYHRRVEEDHLKILSAQSRASGGLVDGMEFNLDHHRRIVAYRGDDIKLEEFKISKTSRAGET